MERLCHGCGTMKDSKDVFAYSFKSTDSAHTFHAVDLCFGCRDKTIASMHYKPTDCKDPTLNATKLEGEL